MAEQIEALEEWMVNVSEILSMKTFERDRPTSMCPMVQSEVFCRITVEDYLAVVRSCRTGKIRLNS